MSFEAVRSHLENFGYCWNLTDEKAEQNNPTDDATNTSNPNNNNNNFVIGEVYGNQKDQFGPNLTPLHRFYKEHKQRNKMPGFRGRRGLCGCFQVKYFISYYLFV